MYIYDLPMGIKTQLCHILDQKNQWENLGITMKYDTGFLTNVKKVQSQGNSPSEELLTVWGQLNHTVLELFILLTKLNLYEASMCVKPYVENTYHHLIELPEHKLNNNGEIEIICNNQENAEDKFEVRGKCKKLHQEIMATRDDNLTDSNNLIDNKMLNKSSIPTNSSIPLIKYEELQFATNNWATAMILGKGGFGTVYKGTWKCTQVAVKRIETRKESVESQRIQLEQSLRELHYLNMYRHDNILPLYGYSLGGHHPCLIYQYMAGGNLEQRLHTKMPEKMLNWAQRWNISKGVARGLQFLHTIGDKPLIHSDIKSANILLDPCNEPKIGDFGLAREGPVSSCSHIEVSRVQGTRPYIPDEFLRSRKMSTKVDTFSFGVVLFELATGLSACIDEKEKLYLKDYIVDYKSDYSDLKDKKCPGADDDVIYNGFIAIGKECVSKKAKDRPEMIKVLLKLENANPSL